MNKYIAPNHPDCFAECPGAGAAIYVEPYGPCIKSCSPVAEAIKYTLHGSSSQTKIRYDLTIDEQGALAISKFLLIYARNHANEPISRLINNKVTFGFGGSGMVRINKGKFSGQGTVLALVKALTN